ncbi:MAG: hypothetical protein ACOYKE_00775 [Ferruginibacter sp.]
MDTTIQQEKAFWESHFNFNGALDQVPISMKQINFKCVNIVDNDLQILVGRIKHIEELNLESTSISNAGIEALTALQSIKTLRLKNNAALTNDCIPALNQLKEVEILEVDATHITIDGLLQLSALKNLKQVRYSAGNQIPTVTQIAQLQTLHPACEWQIV